MPKAKYLKMHQITNRTTFKVLPKEPHSIDFIAQRMYECYATIKKVKGQRVVQDIQHGVIADVIDEKKEKGTWHKVESVEFVKANYEVEDFYKDHILKK